LAKLDTWNGKKEISTTREINAVLLNIKINQSKVVSRCGHNLATNEQKFHRNTFCLSENIAKSFRGNGYFFTHNVYPRIPKWSANNSVLWACNRTCLFK